MLKRTRNCGQLRLDDAGKKVTLAGWVQSYRDHGNLVFFDLRDRQGLTQLVFNPEKQPDVHKLARTVRCEWVIAARGIIQPRGKGLENPKLATGQIEVAVEQFEILSVAKTPPFELEDATKTNEELRLTNRVTISISSASGKSRHQCWPKVPPKEPETFLFPAGCTGIASMHCHSHRSFSSRY